MIQPLLQPQEPKETRKVFSVSEMALTIRRQLEREIGQIWITGEISNFMQPASGHWYFTLKDSNAQLKCAIFKNRNRAARFTPEDGQQVLIRAKLSLYEPRGDLQLIGEYIEPAGEGALQVAFNRLKEKLKAKGLFDSARKKPIPKVPQKIGIVTSASGAAIRDVLTVLKRRMPQVPVIIYPSLVQGDKAAANLIQQIEKANQDNICDVLLVTRGGGSLEDMWCFNDEALAEAIFASELPMVSAVGHEVDISISDMVADLRAPTPSAAAELLVPDQSDYRQQLNQLKRRLVNETQHKLEVTQALLDRLTAQIVHPKQTLIESRAELRELTQNLLVAFRELITESSSDLIDLNYRLQAFDPQFELEQKKDDLALSKDQLIAAFKALLKDKQQQMALSMQQLNDFSPLATLKRGYTITENESGKPLTSVKQAQKAKRLTTKFADGEIISLIKGHDGD
ncbi:exodeoxyribonuclease VII large subunit [Kangiella sp. TOML190]|uniref:exodeoxyribonuclease VII large subunit n=1 Tax=Kangiella sp. TOML190 TaxID=2931351 RepID=UPI00203FF407|nr:exodeoxyribonuclease VII large subunit [Kangiella sp. TOML190]